jgi:hypothetical protein
LFFYIVGFVCCYLVFSSCNVSNTGLCVYVNTVKQDATIQYFIQEVLDSNLGRDNVILTEVVHGFPHSLQVNVGIVHQLVQDLFLPNPFQFILHRSHSMIRRSSLITGVS